MADVDFFESDGVALDQNTGLPIAGAVFQVFAKDDLTFSTPLVVTDPVSGAVIDPLVSSQGGVIQAFAVAGSPHEVNLKSGDRVTPQVSWQGKQGPAGDSAYVQAVAGGYTGTEADFQTGLSDALARAAVLPDPSAHAGYTLVSDGTAYYLTPGPDTTGIPDPRTAIDGQILTIVGGKWVPATAPNSGITGAPASWPTTFPASPHTHVVAQLSDASTVGRAVMAAADAQTARAAIGAGTGNGTSNLALGATATTAAPGNHSHVALSLTYTPTGAITATNVQDAITQAAAMGGSSTPSNVIIWRYASGAYPTLPTSKPAGIEKVEAFGPVQPTNVPSWIGNGAGQALGEYTPTALT